MLFTYRARTEALAAVTHVNGSARLQTVDPSTNARRHDLLTASLDFSAANECADPGFTGALVQDYLVTEPRGLSSSSV